MSETGHAKNISNFAQVISIVSGLGASYDPNNPLIELANLQTKLAALQTAFSAVAPLAATETLAVNDRVAVFEPLSKLVTRISNASAVNINDPLFADNLRTIVLKLQGRRAGQVVNNPENADEPPKTSSASQMSYDNRLAHFVELITLLDTQGSYNPNEADLQIPALQTLLAEMQTKNAAVINATIAVQNARIARDEIAYNDTDGILALANLVKKYVKSLFGANSPQYKQLTALQFRRVR